MTTVDAMNFAPESKPPRPFFFPAWLIVTMLAFPGALLADNTSAAPTDSRPASPLTEIRAYLVPRVQTTLSAQVDAAIQSLPFKEGDTFAAGATLIAFDCATLNAQLNKARAALTAARDKNQVMQRLAQLHSVGTLEADASRSEQAQAEADVKFQESRLRGCRVPAPFAGRVATLMVREHQFVTPGHNLMKILDHRHLEMEMVVPSRWLGWLKVKERFTIQIDETRKTYPARVLRLGAEVDPVSQTVKIVGEPLDTSAELVPGMSGVARFTQPAETSGAAPSSSKPVE